MPFPDTDVLILGSGLAGLYAAIHCRRQGSRVLVCSKSKPGLGSCSSISQGHFRSSTSSFSPGEHKRLSLEAGKGLNQGHRLDTLVQSAPQEMSFLQDLGLNLEPRAQGYDCRPQKPGREGRCVTKPLSKQATRLGVEFKAPFQAWRIAQQEGRAIGVWGFEPQHQKPVLLTCRSLILATGGAGALYAHTDNPQGMTGDGYALALTAGLPLMDMEFVQFYPLCLGNSRTSLLLPPILGEVGMLENVQGQDIVSKYCIQTRPVAIAARDQLCQAMALETQAGLGFPDGGLRLRLSQKDTVWNQAKEMFGLQSISSLRSWAEHLASAHHGDIPVSPAAHFCMGGIACQNDVETNVQGLFAAGEVVGGLHGANRLGGNALAETVVFGRIAAEKASQTAQNLQDPQWSRLEAQQQAPLETLARDRSYSCPKIELQRLMWRYAGILRSAESLQTGLQELAVLEKGPLKRKAGPKSQSKTLELNNMLQIAKTIIHAALARKESRGSHYRRDYPSADQDWNRHIFQYLKAGELQLER